MTKSLGYFSMLENKLYLSDKVIVKYNYKECGDGDDTLAKINIYGINEKHLGLTNLINSFTLEYPVDPLRPNAYLTVEAVSIIKINCKPYYTVYIEIENYEKIRLKSIDFNVKEGAIGHAEVPTINETCYDYECQAVV